MKRITHAKSNIVAETFFLCSLLLACAGVCEAQSTSTPSQVAATIGSDYAITQVNPDSRIWVNSAGQTVTEISTGMHFWNGFQWTPSNPSFVVSPDGTKFVAAQIQAPIQLAVNLDVQGAVSIRTPDNLTLRSTPIAIGLFDAASGLSVIVATLTNSTGVLVDPQDVVYKNALVGGGFAASVVYSLPDTASFHQDVVFTGFDPGFNPTNWGFSENSTNSLQIQIITEFYNPPQPIMIERPLYIEQDPAVRAAMVSPDIIDFTLDFGNYVFGPGRAFTVSTNAGSGGGVTVAKDFVTSSGRMLLVESVPYLWLAGQLQSLPPVVTKTSSLKHPWQRAKRIRVAEASLPLPPPQAKPGPVQNLLPGKRIAGVATKQQGVHIDYRVTVSSTVEPTLYTADTTYFVSGTVVDSSAVTMESAVFKYPTNGIGTIEIQSTLALSTTNYRPAIFTAADDNTAGTALSTSIWSGYTGIPGTNRYGNIALWLNTTAATALNNLRFCYENCAIEVAVDSAGQALNLSHSELVDCITGIYVSGGSGSASITFNANNCLMANVQYPFKMQSVVLTANAYNCTVDACTDLIDVVSATSGTFNLTNSIVSSMGSKGSLGSLTLNGGYNAFSNSSGVYFGSPYHILTSNPYVSVGAGNYYLPTNSALLTDGTTSISSALLSQLHMKTVTAPAILTNSLTSETTLTPVVQRDTNGTALGWHYDPIDYLVGCSVFDATLLLTNGVALAYGDYTDTGIKLLDNSQLVSQGTPNARNYLAYYGLIQEQPTNLWGFTNAVAQALPISPVPTNAANKPSIFLRLTTISEPQGETNLLNTADSNQVISRLTLRDCEVYGAGANWLMNESNNTPPVGLTNNVFHRVPFGITNDAAIIAYNNLFYGSTNTNEFAISIQRRNGSSSNVIENNVFDGVSASLAGQVVGYNAYLHGATNATYTNDIVWTNSFAWVSGPLGAYYQAANGPLLLNGSTAAGNLGLYYYTVAANNAIEGTNTVSRGYHYVALGTNGLPLASTNGGVPDYLEYDTGAPFVAIQPASQTVCVGSNFTFTDVVYGTGPLSFQWKFNGTNLVGDTNASLTLTSVQPANAGSYTVVVTNLLGTATSSSAVLTVVTVASLSPTNCSTCSLISSNATQQTWAVPISTNAAVSNLELIAISNPSLPASGLPAGWSLNGVLTNITYVSITNVGVYAVVCSAGTSTVTNIIWVMENGDVEKDCSSNGPALLGYWSFNNGGTGGWLGNLGQVPLNDYGLQNPASPWTNALKIDTNTSANLSYKYAETNGLENIHCINGAVSFWFKPDWNGAVGPGNPGRLLEMGNTNSTNGWWALGVDPTGSTLTFQSESNGVDIIYFSQSITNWSPNDWYQLVLDYSTEETSLYTNGVIAQIGPGIVNYPTISNRLAYGFSIGSDHTGQSQIRGTIDELLTFNCPLSAQQVTAGLSGYGGYPTINQNAAPSIITQPETQMVAEGGTVTFSVLAIGNSPLSYQWKFDNTNIVGATNSNYIIRNTQTTNIGSYVVVVTNTAGTATSATATLEVPTCTSFTNGSFESGFTGWSYSGTAIVLTNGTGTLNTPYGTHYAEFRGDGPGTISQAVCVQPGYWYQVSYCYAASNYTGQTQAPMIVQVWAADQLLFYGLPDPTSTNWQTNTFQFQAPLNASIATLSFLGNWSSGDGMPTVDNVTFTNLTNAQLPAITEQPVGLTNEYGTCQLGFSVLAAGPGTLTYQWQLDGTNLNETSLMEGTTTSALWICGLTKACAGTYCVIVGTQGSNGTARSSDAVLTVLDPYISPQPQSLAFNLGQTSAALSVNGDGTGTNGGGPTWQWYKNGSALNGQTGTLLFLENGGPIELADAGNYCVVESGLYGSVTSIVATVSVFEPSASFLSQPQSQVACLGDTTTFSVAASGGGLSYQWFDNGVAIANAGAYSGAQTSSLTINGIANSNFATYTVMVTNFEGNVITSTPAILYPTPSLNEGTIAVAMDVGTIGWFLPDGAPNYVLGSQDWAMMPLDMCYNSQESIISAYYNVSALSINNLCDFSTLISGTSTDPFFGPTAVVMDASGNVYVSTAGITDGDGNFHAPVYGIMQFNSSQVFVRGYLSGVPVAAMDLDATQTNLFYIAGYTTERNIYTLAVGSAPSNTPALFSTLTNDGGTPRCLRVLQDGSVLVADEINVKHNNPSGTIAIWNYVDPYVFDVTSLSVDPSGTSVWVSDRCFTGNGSGMISEVSLSATNGAGPELDFYTGSLNQGAVAVEGELRMGRLITLQPLSQTVCSGQNATFTVAASSKFPYPLHYAWYQNGTAISGATSTSWTTSQAGTYTVALTSPSNSAINVSSASAALIVGAPTIDIQPEGESLLTGQSAYLSVVAQGADLSYQWSFNGTNIAGATGSAYSIASVTAANAGSYAVKVGSCTNATNTTSTMAFLAVRDTEPPGFFSGMVNWWPAEGNGNDVIGNENGYVATYSPSVGFDTGEVNQAFLFYGNSDVDVTTNNSADPSTPFIIDVGLGDFSIEFWMQSSAEESEQIMSCINSRDGEGGNAQWQMQIVSGYLSFSLSGSTITTAGYPAYPFFLTSSKSVNDGAFHHVAVVRHGLSLGIYIDGALSSLADAPGVAILSYGSPQLDLGCGDIAGSLAPGINAFIGKLDEITFYDRALSAAEIQLVYNEGNSGKLPRLPLVAFNVQYPYQGDADNSAQIQLSVPGQPNATIYYTTNGTAPTVESTPFWSDIWVFDDCYGNLPSTEITAIAVEPGYLNSEPVSYFLALSVPTITTQPLSQLVQENTSYSATPVEFSVVAQSPAALQYITYFDGLCGPYIITTNLLYFGDTSYQWYFNGRPIIDATNSSLYVSPVPIDVGSYFVTVSNAVGTAISSLATLQVGSVATLLLGDMISWWPAEGNANDVVGNNAGGPNGWNTLLGYTNGGVSYVPGYVGQGFSFSFAGTPTGGSIWVGDSSTLDFTGPFTITAWVFLCDGRTNYPSATSGYRTVMVKGEQYELDYSVNGLRGKINNSVCTGNIPLALNLWHNVAMTYNSSKNVTLYLDGVSCGSASNFTLQQGNNTMLLGTNSGAGDVLDEIVLYNTNLSAQQIAEQAQSTLGTASTVFMSTQPQSQAICAGGSANLLVSAEGRNPLAYQWLLNGAPIPGASGVAYSSPTNTDNGFGCSYSTNAGTYTVVVYDGLDNSVESAPAIVAVSSNPPSITSPVQPALVFVGDTAVFYVGAAGGGLSYQWQSNSVSINGATNSSLVIENVQAAQAGTYSVVIWNGCGNTSSQAALSLVSGNLVGWGTCGTVPVENNVIAVAAGDPQFLALLTNGTVAKWSPSQGVTNIVASYKAASAGSNYDLYLTQSNSVVADGSGTASQPPSSVTSPGTNKVVAIAAGPSHGLALMTNQTVIGWGTGTATNTSGRSNIVAIAAGYLHSLVLNQNGTVACWGDNINGVTNVPSGLSNIVAISAGYVHDMALTAGGTVVAWGNNSQAVTNVPPGLSNVVAIAAGTNYSMALTAGGTVVCWGNGTNGNPVPANLQAVVAIAAGPACPLAVTMGPIITVQPVGATVNSNANVTLGVTAINPAAATFLDYQWQQNGSNIANATSSTYAIAGITSSQEGVYTVLLINSFATNASEPATVLVSNAPPVIVSPLTPVNVSTPVGSLASFTVVAAGTGTLRYQWQLNGAAIAGATATSYTLNSAQGTNAGNYTVVVSNNYGTTLSPDMRLVVEPAFAIVEQPQNQTVAAGCTTTFTVQTIGGVQPLSYQWSYTNDGGSLVLGAAETIVATNVTFSDAGQIFVIVTDAEGHQLTSSNLTLTVIPMWTPVPSGIVAWWKGQSNTTDSIGTNNAISSSVSYVPGEVGTALSFNGVANQVTVADNPSLAMSNTSFTVEGWVKILNDDDVGYPVYPGFIIVRGNTNQVSYYLYVQPDVAPGWAEIDFAIISNDTNGAVASCIAAQEQWTHVAAVFDSVGQTMTIYVNGQVGIPTVEIASINYSTDPLTGVTNTPANDLTRAEIGIGNYPEVNPTWYPFCGMIDELCVYTNALAQSQVQAIYNSATVGKQLMSGPAILTQPASQTVFLGSNATFYVVAQGPGALNYQWYLNGTPLEQLNATLIIANAQSTDQGTYSVIVSDPYASTTSSNATLALGDPVITSPPLSQSAGPGMSVTFNVAAVGATTLTYQWHSNSVAIAGATTSMFTLTNVQTSYSASYAVVVSDQNGSITSAPAVLTVQDPFVSAWPMSQAVFVGQSEAFTVGVSGTDPFTYQWSHNGTNISGATASAYSIASVQTSNSGSYQVVVNGKSQVTANAYLSAIQHPVASPDIFPVPQNTSANQLSVLANDSLVNGNITYASPFGGTLNIISVTAASHGIVSIANGGQSLNYNSSLVPGYFGPDTFSYTITDGSGATATAQVTVFVNENGNGNPIAANYSVTLEPGQYTATVDVLAGATDPDSDVLSVYSVGSPSKGAITLGQFGEITYTRTPAQYGNDTFSFILTDGNGGYATSTIQVMQADNNGNGIPDQWETDNNLNLSESASQGSNGLPNIVNYLLDGNPNMTNNALNLGAMHDFGGGVNMLLYPPGRIASSASLFAIINGQEASQPSIFFLPDGTCWLNFATATLSPGDYEMQLGLRTAVNGDIGNTYSFTGKMANLAINNTITINNLTAEYAGSLNINGWLNVPADAYSVSIYNTQHSLLTTLTGTPQNALINSNWDLTYGDGQTASGPLVVQMNASLGGVSRGSVWMDYHPSDSINGSLWVVAMGTPSVNSDVNNSEAADIGLNVLLPLSYLGYIDDDVLPGLKDTGDVFNYNSVTADNTFMWETDTESDSLNCREILTNCLAGPSSVFFYWCRGHGDWEAIAPSKPLPENEFLFATNLAYLLQNAQYQGILDPPLFVRVPNQHPYRLTILLACGTYSYLWATTFGITRYVAPGSPWETKAIYDAAGVQHRAFVGWVPQWIWTYDDQQSAGEKALFDDWQRQGTIEDCMDAWASAALLALQDIPNPQPWTLSLAKYLEQYYISGCKDLDYTDGGILQ